MKIIERLDDFNGSVLSIGLSAPDEYPEHIAELWGGMAEAHEANMEILSKYWQALRPLIKRDVDKIPFIEERMQAALASFAEGKREPGRTLLLEIYNLPLRKLR